MVYFLRKFLLYEDWSFYSFHQAMSFNIAGLGTTHPVCHIGYSNCVMRRVGVTEIVNEALTWQDAEVCVLRRLPWRDINGSYILTRTTVTMVLPYKCVCTQI
jgi:hypothetical protein